MLAGSGTAVWLLGRKICQRWESSCIPGAISIFRVTTISLNGPNSWTVPLPAPSSGTSARAKELRVVASLA